jgi:hypothetical protein
MNNLERYGVSKDKVIPVLNYIMKLNSMKAYPLLDLGHIFSFLILYTVGRTPWTGDQPF